jgi:hypothetical protein
LFISLFSAVRTGLGMEFGFLKDVCKTKLGKADVFLNIYKLINWHLGFCFFSFL